MHWNMKQELRSNLAYWRNHGSMYMQWFDWEGRIQVHLQLEIIFLSKDLCGFKVHEGVFSRCMLWLDGAGHFLGASFSDRWTMDALAKASPLGVRKVKPPLEVWAALWNRLYRGWWVGGGGGSASLLKSPHLPQPCSTFVVNITSVEQGSWRVCIVLMSRPRWMVRVLSEGRAPEESASPWQTPCDGQCVSLAFLSGAGAWRSRLKPMAPSWRDRLYD